MTDEAIKAIRKLEIPGVVDVGTGEGGLARLRIQTRHSHAEIYLHGAQVTGFQKAGEPPMLFLSRLSQFGPGKAIRGGVPICFPWFGPRVGNVAHGFARITEWELAEATAASKEEATLRLRLPETPAKRAWPAFDAEFVVTVGEKLSMELVVVNRAARGNLEFENCLHTYLAVGDIHEVSIVGLKGVSYLDKTQAVPPQAEAAEAIRITGETNRVYRDTTGPIEIHDAKFSRTIHIDKSGSASTVLWNPWTTQRMTDLDPAEHQFMVCVESGNVGANKLSLAPGQTSRLKVVLSSEAAQ